MPKPRPTEIELKFLVPRTARAAVAQEMTRTSSASERRTLAAMYLDTPDRRLAREGIAWRLRREGRRWIQTLKGGGASPIERFEHEVIRSGPSHDLAAHAGTQLGEKLASILGAAREDGIEVGVRFRTEVRRVTRRVRTRGAIVELAFDEGRVLANAARLPLRELEFELVSGSATAMLGLAERWRKRFGLVYDPRSKAERGDRLAEGSAFPPVRKARRIDYPRDVDAVAALGAVLDECIAQVTHNAIGLVDGDESLRAGYVHQMRVGIRRLRSALRCFEGWTPAPPRELVDGLRGLFAELGRMRDSDVLDSGVAAELARAGAPPLQPGAADAGPDPAALVREPASQKTLLAWISWRVGLAQAAAARAAGDQAAPQDVQASVPVANPADAATEARTDALAQDRHDGGAKTFHHDIERRLQRWHRRIMAASRRFDQLDEDSLHSLRKRIKRQRYAVEFFAPVLRRKAAERYLEPLVSIQERMGELNDLFVARQRYRSVVDADPAAWFALGWLAARIAEVRRLAQPELKRLARTDPPRT